MKELKLIIALFLVSISNICIANNWQEVEQALQNTVVQVWAQTAIFNWTEPYKAPELRQGAGSGFFINDSGDLLTNYHVIDQAKSIVITVPYLGRKLLEVSIVGVCPESDVALLRLTPESMNLLKKSLGKIPYIRLGDSDILFPTQPVLALGYPLGQRYLKATVGVIAGREYLDGSSYMHITAPINPGNSGGPLLNLKGEVVGINSAGIPGSQNIGYIIPINEIKIILSDLFKTGLCRKPDLGIGYNHATDVHAASLKNPKPGGVFINYVQEDSIAQKLGICVGDMLYSISTSSEEFNIDEYGDVEVKWRNLEKISLEELLIRFHKDEKVKFVIYRNGERKVINGNFSGTPLYPIRYIHPDFEDSEIDYETIGGLVIMQLRENHFKVLPQTTMLKAYTRPDHQIKEVLVITNLLPGSQMHKLRCFHPGMLIESINGISVKNLKQLRDALNLSLSTKEIAVTTKDKFSSVVSLDKILQDEPRLARDFKFPITPSVKNLMTKFYN